MWPLCHGADHLDLALGRDLAGFRDLADELDHICTHLFALFTAEQDSDHGSKTKVQLEGSFQQLLSPCLLHRSLPGGRGESDSGFAYKAMQ